MLPESVRSKLDLLPASPGVYVFRDERGGVLYVGKASSLRNRVRSYFQEGTTDARAFIPRLYDEIGDLETIVVSTEKEATLLESSLIKEHRPRYNVKLRDDKDYLSLRLDSKAPWPRLEVVRRPRPDGAHYFGPYHSATSARQTLRLVNRHFQLRTCTDTDFASRTRPCLQYQIKRCSGPCVFDVDREKYLEQVRSVTLFLDGKHDELVTELQDQMKRAAEAMDYEQAGVFRDQLRAVERVREEQNVSVVRDIDQDVIGMFRQGDQAEVAVLMIREGKLIGVRTFPLSNVSIPDDELVASFVSEYYGLGSFVPDEVLLQVDIEARAGIAEALAEKSGKRVEVLVPQRGARTRLLTMAKENAAHAFRENARAKEDVEERLGQLMTRLRLPTLPRRIECIDVSHTGGTDTVAAIVALANGEPDRKRYKSFHVRRAAAGDDYGAMYEVLSRRFRRGREGEKGWELPDLLMVDGGKGQLQVALAALKDLGVAGLPIVALAKEKENVAGEKLVDRVYLPGQKNPVPLRDGSASLHFLGLARDEAHRVSNVLRKKLAKRKRLRSGLDDIAGVGPKTRNTLLRKLGSLRAVMQATEDELVSAGASRKQAHAIRLAFNRLAPESLPPEPTTLHAAEDWAIANAWEPGTPG